MVGYLVTGAIRLARGQRAHVVSFGFGADLRPPFLCKIQVVLHQGILGVDTAADHAAAAVCAGAPWRALAVKIWIGDIVARLDPIAGEEHAHVRWAEGCLTAQLLGDLLHNRIRRGEPRVGGDAQHTAGGIIMRLQQAFPIRQVLPGRVAKM